MYIYQRPEWPRFDWDRDTLITPLADLRHKQGRLIGYMAALGLPLRAEAELQTLTLDVLKSNEIEGELLNPAQVRSSIARRLGIDTFSLVPVDRNVEGVVDVLLNASQHGTENLPPPNGQKSPNVLPTRPFGIFSSW